MKEDTIIVTAGRKPEENFGFVNPPVYHASTILSSTVEERRARTEKRWEPDVFTYGRQGTPTHWALEDALSAIEGGERCLLTSSGLNAITTALLAFVVVCLCQGALRVPPDHMNDDGGSD